MNAGPVASLEREINFGGNQGWHALRYRPASEAEVLQILARHAGDRIRVLGSKHSWSDIGAQADVSLDMSRMDEVTPFVQDGENFARVGAGCTLQSLLDRLHAKTDQTLPTLGAIKKQTISGAISTGTHGSGRQSFSHFVTRIRLAAYDPASGQPKIFDYRDGDELRAARCGLGCMGVILLVELRTVPKYTVSEIARLHPSLDSVLQAYAERPLTQFVLTPYGWKWVAFERKVTEPPARSFWTYIRTRLFRLYATLGPDILFHLLVLGSRAVGAWAVKGFMRFAHRIILKNRERIDDSEHVLTMGHYYFRHEEMEIFVKEAQLPDAVALLRDATEAFAASGGDAKAEQPPQAGGAPDELSAHRGSYVHHYVFFFRRVLPDDTLVSMTASTHEPSYSISVFTYDPPSRRQPYYEFCRFLARTMTRRFGARLHWGKHFPLRYADVVPLYPQLETFRQLCGRNDHRGVFRNGYTKKVLELPAGAAQGRGDPALSRSAEHPVEESPQTGAPPS